MREILTEASEFIMRRRPTEAIELMMRRRSEMMVTPRPLMLKDITSIGAIVNQMTRRGLNNKGDAQGTENQWCADWMAEGPMLSLIGEIAGD